MKHHESGKVRLIKGSLLYFWEELKTMNMVKLKALLRIISGYVRMKFMDQKKHRQDNDLSLDRR